MKSLKVLVVLSLLTVLCMPGVASAYTSYNYFAPGSATLPGYPLIPTYNTEPYNAIMTFITENPGGVATFDVARVAGFAEVAGQNNAIVPGWIGLTDTQGTVVDQLYFGNVFNAGSNKTRGTVTMYSDGAMQSGVTYALTLIEHADGDLLNLFTPNYRSASYLISYAESPVPLPPSVLLMGSGLLGLGLLGRRKVTQG